MDTANVLPYLGGIEAGVSVTCGVGPCRIEVGFHFLSHTYEVSCSKLSKACMKRIVRRLARVAGRERCGGHAVIFAARGLLVRTLRLDNFRIDSCSERCAAAVGHCHLRYTRGRMRPAPASRVEMPRSRGNLRRMRYSAWVTILEI